MNDVYGQVVESRLTPRERDVVSGRRTARREDKRRERPKPEVGRRASTPASRARWAAGGLALVLVVIAASFAVAGRGPDAPSAASRGAGEATTPSPSSSPEASEAPATAILLEYRGGDLTRHECSDANGGGRCVYFESENEPLMVRCTAAGCTAELFGSTVDVDEPVTLSGRVDAPEPECEPTRWSLDLRPVGESVTEGLRHPARLVGTTTASRPAEVVGGFNCLGAEEEFRYDAVPS